MKRVVVLSFVFAAVALAGCGNTGIVCSSTEVRCGNTCANLQINPDHCGACGQACPTGFSCVSGACACPTGFTACGQQCVSLKNSGQNCGTCGVACTGTDVCEDGGCTGACDGANINCGGGCVDPSSDPQNCGGCAGDGGMACPQGQACVNGVCGPNLYAACFNSGEVFALDAQGEVASPTKATAPPTNPIGLAFHGHDALEVLDSSGTLYDFDVSSGFSSTGNFAVGQGPNAIAVQNDTAAVVNSTDGTLDVLTSNSAGWERRCAGDGGGCTASVNLGASTFPQYAAFGTDAIYVSLQGDTFGSGDPDAGNKVVRVSLADLSTQVTDLSGLDLQTDAGTAARPQGIAYVNGQVFVALANLAGFTAGAPGLVEVLDEPHDGGALIPHGQPIKLGDGCINAGDVLPSGNLVYVACGPAFDPNTFALTAPGAVAALDTTTLQPAFAPSTLGCPSGSTGCVPGGATRLALASGKLFVGDVNDGRLFVADPQTGALSRGPANALELCPAPDGGFNFISDVAARP